jgi:hypothetical protein
LEKVPCRTEPTRRADDLDGFVRLLREYNRQREKSLDEKLREEVVSADPTEAYQSLIEHRRVQSALPTSGFDIVGVKTRCEISNAKLPFLGAVLKILEERRAFWPLSDRSIHYALLNDPPLIHASKSDSTYTNTPRAYKSLTDLLTRARLEGYIPWNAIADPTRPVVTWSVHREPRSFIRGELGNMLKGYWRDLQQSQPNHIEIVGEKNTIESIIRPVASEYCIPMTIGRGFCSIQPRYEMAQRFKASGKEKLILLVISDFDPDGEEIAHSFARSMRDDFGVDDIHPVKVALTAEQVSEYKLPVSPLQAKKLSTNREKFVARYGSDEVFELEALPPEELQALLRKAIDSVLDVDKFNAELEAEKADAAFLEGVRRTIHSAIGEMTF